MASSSQKRWPGTASELRPTIQSSRCGFLRETHYDGSRAGKNFALDRQTEPLVLPSEVSGLDDLRGFLKYGNHVARFSFPFIALDERSRGFDEQTMDELMGP